MFSTVKLWETPSVLQVQWVEIVSSLANRLSWQKCTKSIKTLSTLTSTLSIGSDKATEGEGCCEDQKLPMHRLVFWDLPGDVDTKLTTPTRAPVRNTGRWNLIQPAFLYQLDFFTFFLPLRSTWKFCFCYTAKSRRCIQLVMFFVKCTAMFNSQIKLSTYSR